MSNNMRDLLDKLSNYPQLPETEVLQNTSEIVSEQELTEEEQIKEQIATLIDELQDSDS